MDFQNSSWNICISSLVILAVSVFEIFYGKTNRQTNSSEIFTWAIAVGMGKEVANTS